MFDGTEELGFIQNIKAKYKAKTDFYKTNNTKLLERVRSANSNVLNYLKPKRIDSNTRESYNISSMVEFEKVCAGLQEQTPAIKVKDMTVMEFYSKIELLKEREKSMKS